jgi:hypothetical protein
MLRRTVVRRRTSAATTWQRSAENARGGSWEVCSKLMRQGIKGQQVVCKNPEVCPSWRPEKQVVVLELRGIRSTSYWAVAAVPLWEGGRVTYSIYGPRRVSFKSTDSAQICGLANNRFFFFDRTAWSRALASFKRRLQTGQSRDSLFEIPTFIISLLSISTALNQLSLSFPIMLPSRIPFRLLCPPRRWMSPAHFILFNLILWHHNGRESCY